MARERLDFLAHDFVDMVFALKEVMQDLFRFCKRAALVGEAYEPTFSYAVDDQVG